MHAAAGAAGAAPRCWAQLSVSAAQMHANVSQAADCKLLEWDGWRLDAKVVQCCRLSSADCESALDIAHTQRLPQAK